MDFGLRDKVALVCGASRGIGFATADELAREGMALAICSRDAASIQMAAQRLGPRNVPLLPLVADLATPEGIAHVSKETQRRFGRVDVLITNTGGPPTGATLSHDWAAWDAAVALLLRSAVELTRAFVPGMRERKWGRVIGITSLAVKAPVPSLVLSNSLRAAVTGYFRTLADEVAADGVTVNTVLPGYTETERLRDLADATTKRTGASRESVYEQWRATTPAHRLGKPEELAAVAAFLASDRAGFVTGQAICVDGGAVRSLL
ncbi:MAG TPA: SDR family oxidoreductase [Gemmatimonadales bacterium]|jgi:3-oxoacyl-[acyl-carrier protein] reductase|nr:SDR family oxidoreductase [Gemmatimonadales bacterium]